jgi:hypothetical protein
MYAKQNRADASELGKVRARLAAAKTRQECDVVDVTDALRRNRQGCYYTATAIICDS